MRLERLLCAWMLLGGDALAWSLNGSTWGWQGLPIEDPVHVAPDSFDPGEVSEAALLDAVDDAMLTWNASGYNLQLIRGESVIEGSQDPEGQLTLFQGAVADSGVTLAFTAVWGYEDGEAFDCDVMFLDLDDEGDIVWSADPEGPPEGAWDVGSVALHELGHCLGLSHSADEAAIMYPRYSGSRALGDDDLAGLAALYAPRCADSDGDGVSECAGDCADDNALVSSATRELCNGVDDNCNGAIDELEGLALTLGDDSNHADWSALSVGNGLAVEAATTLRSLRQRWEAPEGSRLVWSVSRLDGRRWTLVAEARGEAVSGEWQQSPDLDVVLLAGETYAVVLGSVADGVTMYYKKRPSLATNGPITPLGSLYGRAIGDALTEPASDYLVYQELTLTAVEDPALACGGDTGDTGDTSGPDTAAPDTADGDGHADTGKAAGCACAAGTGQTGVWSGLAIMALWSQRCRDRRAPRDRLI